MNKPILSARRAGVALAAVVSLSVVAAFGWPTGSGPGTAPVVEVVLIPAVSAVPR